MRLNTQTSVPIRSASIAHRKLLGLLPDLEEFTAAEPRAQSVGRKSPNVSNRGLPEVNGIASFSPETPVGLHCNALPFF